MRLEEVQHYLKKVCNGHFHVHEHFLLLLRKALSTS